MFGIDHKHGKLMMIACERLRAGKAQPRKRFTEEELSSLAESIRVNGVLQPILVRKKEGVFEIIAGERRFRASQMAGLHEIPCVCMNMTDSEAAVASLLENLQRQDLSFFEEAEAIANLIEQYHLTQEQAAEQLGKRQSTVANKLRLLRFCAEEREQMMNHHLTERHARALLSVENPVLRGQLIQLIGEQGLNVAQTEKAIAQAIQNVPVQSTPKRMFVAKDVRLFLNTIEHAIRVMRDSGISAEQEKQESDEFVEIKIRIPKSEVYRGKTA